jgi:hypothetical protein
LREVDVVPAQRAKLGSAQSVPEGDQDHGGVAMAIAVVTGRLHQPADPGWRKILAWAQICVGLTARWLNSRNRYTYEVMVSGDSKTGEHRFRVLCPSVPVSGQNWLVVRFQVGQSLASGETGNASAWRAESGHQCKFTAGASGRMTGRGAGRPGGAVAWPGRSVLSWARDIASQSGDGHELSSADGPVCRGALVMIY